MPFTKNLEDIGGGAHTGVIRDSIKSEMHLRYLSEAIK